MIGETDQLQPIFRLAADHLALHFHVIGAECDLQQINSNNGGT